MNPSPPSATAIAGAGAGQLAGGAGLFAAAVADPGGGGGGVDLISELPEQLRLHILTFLPLASAIRTSPLSSRWRNLFLRRWVDPSNLHFLSPAVSPELFVGHVTRTLALLPAPRRIDSLRIAFRPLPHHIHHIPHLATWITYAVDCLVIDLLLDLTYPYQTNTDGDTEAETDRPDFELNRPFLSLVRLLLGGFYLHTRSIAQMPSLEVIVLYKVDIEYQTIMDLMGCCPLLRSLELRACGVFKNVTIVGEELGLRKLSIIDCDVLTRLELSGPRVRSLRLRGEFMNLCFWDMEALEDLCVSWGVGPPKHLPVIDREWVDELLGLSSVRVLSLCSLTLQYISTFESTAVFSNLKELQFLMHMLTKENIFDICAFFNLCLCPCLEKIFIELPTTVYSAVMKMEDSPSRMWFEHVKIIRMNNFNGYDNEMCLVSWFLKRARKLEYMILVPARDFRDQNSEQFVIPDRLISLPKSSPNAMVVLDDNDCSGWHPTHSEV